MRVELLRILAPAVFAGLLAAQPDIGHVVQTNLVSDVAGTATHVDPHLINPWGVSRSAAGPWWVSNAGTGTSTVYDGSGNLYPTSGPLVVTVPGPGGVGQGVPTGQVFNGTTDFQLAPGSPAVFIFATAQGTISGWNSAVNPTTAVNKVDNSSKTAAYTGLALAQQNGANRLYAANFHGATIDVFDATFAPVTLGQNAFRDPDLPSGYAPFNIQNIGGMLYVAYAKQDENQQEEDAGPGKGYVDVYDTSGVLQMSLQHGIWMNAPWGLVMAPAGYAQWSNRILVGQFGSGRIASFNATTGKFTGFLTTDRREPVVIEGLWALSFGNGGTAGPATSLYFTAGIEDEAHGLFGTLTIASGGYVDEENQ